MYYYTVLKFVVWPKQSVSYTRDN